LTAAIVARGPARLPARTIEHSAAMTAAHIGLTATALVAQALKEVGVPSPGVTQGALVYAGYQLASGQHLSGALIIIAVYVGSLSGALLAFSFGRSLGAGLAGRRGGRLRLSARDMERAKARLGKGTLWAVTIGRMIPAIMAPLSLVAGMMRVRVMPFAAGVSLSTLAWAGLLAGAGAAGGGVFDRAALRAGAPFLAIFTIAAILATAAAILWWWSARTAEGGEFDAR
jgi:membrane protein DedA with SNARE-associated domain